MERTLTDRFFTRVIPLAALVISLVAFAVAVGRPSSLVGDRSVAVRATKINADRVDGLHASRKIRPGRLLALDKRGRFPLAAMPAGLAGTPGLPGAPGGDGANGANGANGADGADGATGATGPAGVKGDVGATGVSGREIVTASTALDSTDVKSVYVTCPSGKSIIGGGAKPYFSIGIEPIAIVASYPDDLAFPFPPANWIAMARETAPTANNWQLTAVGVCAFVN
jgi:hypothetical protein